MLNKSPKTLSNLFRKISDKSPLQFIHSRRMLEARRLLLHSTSSIKEVAYELGFEDLQTFSRFFKREEGKSPTAFQELNVGKNS
jgi:AraC family transcriptional activator of pobA